MIEIRDIPGFPGYGATANGDIFTRKRQGKAPDDDRWREANQKISNKYMMVSISLCGVSKWRLVHRLIFITWVGEIGPNMHIDHLDGNKLNNNISNLEPVTPRENVARAIRNGSWSERVGILNPNSRARRAARLSKFKGSM